MAAETCPVELDEDSARGEPVEGAPATVPLCGGVGVGPEVAGTLGVGAGVGEGRAVGVRVGRGVEVRRGVGVLVGLNVGVGVRVGVMVGEGVGEGVGTTVAPGVGVGDGVRVVRAGVAVGVAWGGGGSSGSDGSPPSCPGPLAPPGGVGGGVGVGVEGSEGPEPMKLRPSNQAMAPSAEAGISMTFSRATMALDGASTSPLVSCLHAGESEDMTVEVTLEISGPEACAP